MESLLEGRTPCARADGVRPSTGGSDGTSPSNMWSGLSCLLMAGLGRIFAK
ncbi:hypothetical protein [Pontiella desulfatans]|uniref:hypothetical protein n=1 Tax=Pontiella desulfatans TaxID=2750659 RepID=UPI00144417C8|nr:hypothetical protein [Pontiella desulfatans]